MIQRNGEVVLHMLENVQQQTIQLLLTKPMQNLITEPFMGTLKHAHVDYLDFPDPLRQIAHWLEVQYNTQPIHSSLTYTTPLEFETAALGSISPSI